MESKIPTHANKEYHSNWHEAYEPRMENTIPTHANTVTCHVVSKVKADEVGSRTLKARIIPHGNHDAEKDDIGKDSASAQLNTIRLVLSISTILSFRLSTADIKGAYLQGGRIRRAIYVRTPMEIGESRKLKEKEITEPKEVSR